MASPFSRQQSPRTRSRTTSGSIERRHHDDLGVNAESPRSTPPAAHRHSVSVDTGTENKSRYDSDSDEEDFRTQRRHKRPSILRAGIGLLGHLGSLSRDDDDDSYSPDHVAAAPKDDDSVVSDDCMILTDDEDDASEIEVTPKKDDDQDILGAASPRSSATLEAAKFKAMFAETRPWRRQSRRESTALRMTKGHKLPSTSTGLLEDEGGEPFLKSKRDKRTGLVLAQSRSEEEEDDSSSASEDDSLSMQSSVSVISDPEQEIDFDALDKIPSHFTSQPQVMLSYLDPSLRTISEHDSNVFAYEHSLLLRAVMQLLAERDYIGVEADLDDPLCIVKKGPLKKATQAVGRTTWRVKYVEIRPGSFSYFEDSANSEKLGRKTIPLRSTKCICESVKRNQFALEVEGGPRRLWMTNSEEERSAWVRAIQAAMIGAGAGDSSHPLDDETQYQAALDQFQEMQSNLFQANSQAVYMSVIDQVLQTTIRIPVQWVRDRATGVYGCQSNKILGSSAQKHLVTGFWKSLKRESVSINGHEVSSNSPHAPERVVGALSRCILEFDKSSPLAAFVPMSELQAISYARDVMMAVLRTRNKQESYLALDYLCQNSSLVSVEPVVTSELEKNISIQVNYASPEASENPKRDISGWVGTRQRTGRTWRNRFIIISDGILHVFEHNSPRPHGLKGQLLLAGASVSVVEDRPKSEASLYILRVASRNQESEYHLSFPDEYLQQEWQHVIQKAIDSCPVPVEEDPASIASSRKSMFLVPTPGGTRIIKSASESSAKLIKDVTGQFMKATDIIRSMRPSAGINSRTPSMDMHYPSISESEPTQSLGFASSVESESVLKQEPTVQIMAESVSMYRIVACKPSGLDEEDIWVTVRTKILHTFLLAGGSSGRLAKGDEVVEMEFRRGMVSEDEFLFAESMTPRSILLL